MAITFDALPKEKPEGFSLVPEGFQVLTITKPLVKTSKAGNEYLEIQLRHDSGAILFDRIMLSDAPSIQYKLSRFVTACKLPLVGEITFQDLSKVVEGKQIVADVQHKENEYNDKVTTQAEVDIFSNDIYYPVEDYATLVPGAAPVSNDTTPTTGTY